MTEARPSTLDTRPRPRPRRRRTPGWDRGGERYTVHGHLAPAAQRHRRSTPRNHFRDPQEDRRLIAPVLVLVLTPTPDLRTQVTRLPFPSWQLISSSTSQKAK